MPLNKNILKYRPGKNGQLECGIRLNRLFHIQKEYKDFKNKWPLFLKSDKNNGNVYKLEGDFLKYQTEELIPIKTDSRTPLLLLFGNPASHSVISGMFFAFEANINEHRLWKSILRPAGIIDLTFDKNQTVHKKNELRRNQILELNYNSPFRVGLSVFISMPSGASGEWSGVAGIKKLIGSKAMLRIEKEEKRRVLAIINNFIPNRGNVVVFQKNAWNNLKSNNDMEYSRKIVNKEGIIGTVDNFSKVKLFCVPPTRLSGPAYNILKIHLNNHELC